MPTTDIFYGLKNAEYYYKTENVINHLTDGLLHVTPLSLNLHSPICQITIASVKTRLNGSNKMVQHHSILLDATC